MSVDRFKNIKACVFDAYGTLFNIQAIVENYRPVLGPATDKFAAVWRKKQLEYCWLRSLMKVYTDFWEVTQDALDYTLNSIGIQNPTLKQQLMNDYLHPSCYPEVLETLNILKHNGLKLAVLSNGSPFMLKTAIAKSGVEGIVDIVLSVDEVGVYKPHPKVYQLAVNALKLSPREMCFQSSNAWDVAGAATFGLRVAWVNRFDQLKENLPFGPDAELSSLAELPDLLGIATK